MWTTVVTRSGFLDLLASKALFQWQEAADIRQVDPPERSAIRLVLDSPPSKNISLPTTIITGGVDTRDFLAWAGSYLQGFTPFTAFFRVYDWPTFLHSLEIEERPTLGRIKDAVAAVVIAEALAQSASLDINALSMRSLAATFSFVAGRAIANNSAKASLEPLKKRWETLNRLTSQPRRRVEAESLNQIWTTLLSLNIGELKFAAPFESRLITEACGAILGSKEITPTIWDQLTGGSFFLQTVREEMKKNREHRVILLRQMLSDIPASIGRSPLIRDFLVGYLVSQISPGSLTHQGFLGQFSEQYPTATLWQAVCNGLRPENDVAKSFGCLGRRILRDITLPENPFSVPRCDIALDELEMLLGSENRDTSFRRASPNFLSVEVLPCTTAELNWPRRNHPADQSDLFQQETPILVAEEVAELQANLARTQAKLAEFARKISSTRDPKTRPRKH